MKHPTTLLTLLLAGLCAAGLATAARAGAYEELELEINRVAAQQVELQQVARERAERLAVAAQDPRNSTPEIAALRQKLQALKASLLETEQALQEKLANLPALQAETAQLQADRARIAELGTQRRALQEKRANFFKPPAPPAAPAPAP